MPIGYFVTPDGIKWPVRGSSWIKVKPSNNEGCTNLPVGTVLTYIGHSQEAKATFSCGEDEYWMDLEALTEFWEYYPN